VRIECLPEALTPRLEVLRGRQTFRDTYGVSGSYKFGMAPIASLITPQFDVDLDYVEELSRQFRNDLGVISLFGYAFGDGELRDPLVRANEVYFTSHRRDLHCYTTPIVRRGATGDYEISVRAVSRPNYVQVAVLDNERVVLTNGVHRALAFLTAGESHIPCLWRRVADPKELGLDQSGTYLFTQLLSNGPRPALVQDFFNPSIAAPLMLRSMDLVMRISIGADVFTIPTP
jgi:hypothetical protein